MVKVKIFESYSIPALEMNINEFLQKRDEKDLIEIKIVTAQRDDSFPSTNYVAVVICRD
jgi:hypothetical protein